MIIENLYKTVYLIRSAEKAIQKYYFEDEMKTPMHMSMGAEAISAGVCACMEDSDKVFGTYRSHALYLAKTGDVDSFFAELFGKSTGTARGKSGSMHLSDYRKGHFGSSAVVATPIPVAVGCSFASKYSNRDEKTAVFFGDGAADEGVFWESLNLACVMKIPVMFVCEDNGLAVHTFKKKRQGYNSLEKIIENFNCSVFRPPNLDAESIHETAKKAFLRMSKTSLPSVLICKYFRYLEHVGISEDFDVGYRDKQEYNEYRDDPVLILRNKLSRNAFVADILRIESDINTKVKIAVQKAKQDTFTPVTETHEKVYSD